MRKTHTPAYCPALCGVNAEDQSGVDVDVKNIMDIDSIPIMDDILGMELLVGWDIDSPSVADAGIIVEIDISMTAVSVVYIFDTSGVRTLWRANRLISRSWFAVHVSSVFVHD